MPLYDVIISRTYMVRIKARNETTARRASEFFLLTPEDGSKDRPDLRKQYGFHIEEIEMEMNDAVDVKRVRA